jgi:hypothetical protein
MPQKRKLALRTFQVAHPSHGGQVTPEGKEAKMRGGLLTCSNRVVIGDLEAACACRLNLSSWRSSF